MSGSTRTSEDGDEGSFASAIVAEKSTTFPGFDLQGTRVVEGGSKGYENEGKSMIMREELTCKVTSFNACTPPPVPD